MAVTPDAVRELLSSGEAEPTLVIHEGATKIVSGAELQDGRYRGSVVVTSRDDLRQLAGNLDVDDPSERDLQELAERLNTAVTGLGG